MAFVAFALSARAADVRAGLETLTFRGGSYVVREIDPKKDDLRFFLKNDQGVYLHDFTGLEAYLLDGGEKLVFAANAGMFQPDSSPVGLLVLNGQTVAPLNTTDGQENFFMKPNGVFLINAKHEARIVNAADYADELTPALWATQSGPLLVQRGTLHPDFNAESKNLKIRSGVGVRADGVAVFALSRTPVNFYHFAVFFRDRLKCPNALFLDGEISQFYTPGFVSKQPPSFGPMLGVVVKAP